MNKYDNVRDALKDAIEIGESESLINRDKQGNVWPATVVDVQELILERLYNIADLLDMSDLYLEGSVNEKL